MLKRLKRYKTIYMKSTTVKQRRAALFLLLAVLLACVITISPFLSVRHESSLPLKIAYSAGADINAFCARDELRGVLSLTHLSLSNYTRMGEILTSPLSSESFGDKTYEYSSPVTVTWDYDDARDVTVCTIKLRPDLNYHGGKITADDLIFTYYVLLDTSYTGALKAGDADIVGLEEYRANNSLARKITDDEIFSLLEGNDYDADLIEMINEMLIIPTLENELEEYRNLCSQMTPEDFESRYGAATPEDLLVGIFGDPGEVSDDDFIRNIALMYEGDYRKFALAYTGTSSAFQEYFRPEAEKIAIEYLRSKFPKGDEVDRVSGIEKIDSLTVSISYYGNMKSDLDNLLDVFIAPLDIYGNRDLYDYESDKFGFSRSDVSSVCAVLPEVQTGGAYYYHSKSDDVIYLRANDGYYLGQPIIRSMQLVHTSSEGVSDIPRDVDMFFSEKPIDSSDDYTKIDVATGNLVYIGINADRVSVFDGGASYSANLRKAFRALFSYASSVSSADIAATEMLPLSYPAPYNTPYFKSDSAWDISESSVLESVKKFLTDAGFVFDDEIGKFTVAADGARLEYELLLPLEYKDNVLVKSVLEKSKDLLARIGLTLSITESLSESGLQSAIMSGRHDFWITAADTLDFSGVCKMFSSDEFVSKNMYGANYFNYSDSDIESAISEFGRLSSGDMSKFYEAVHRSNVIVPLYQEVNHLYLKSDSVYIDSFPKDLTQYYSWNNAVESIITD